MNLSQRFRASMTLWILFALGANSPVGLAQVKSRADSADHWIPTWVAAPQQGRPTQPIRIPQAPAAARPTGPALTFNDQTVRMVVHTSIGGSRVRIQLSNAYGSAPLQIGPAHIALRGKESAIVSGSDRALTFSGKPSFSIPIGAIAVSDAVSLDVPPQQDLLVSVYVPGETEPLTVHSVGLHTTYISKHGDFTGAPEISDPQSTQSWYWLSSVDVGASAETALLVTFGDSITDGTRSTPNTDSSWPSFLTRRLLSGKDARRLAVVNEGISGNRIFRDGIGPAGLARFDRDVIAQPGIKWVTILEGINDIGAGIGEAFVFGPRPNAPPSENPTKDDLIGAYLQFIQRAHTHGIRVIGCTLLPFEGAAYYSENGNVVRQAVNEWMRTSHAFDSIVDFDAVIRSSESPNKMRAEFDSGDHLHPNDAGYKAMADAVDLSIFNPARK